MFGMDAAERTTSERSQWRLGFLIGLFVLGPALACGLPSTLASVVGWVRPGAPVAIAFAVGIVLALVAPIGLLVRRETRPWGLGALIGVVTTLVITTVVVLLVGWWAVTEIEKNNTAESPVSPRVTATDAPPPVTARTR